VGNVTRLSRSIWLFLVIASTVCVSTVSHAFLQGNSQQIFVMSFYLTKGVPNSSPDILAVDDSSQTSDLRPRSFCGAQLNAQGLNSLLVITVSVPWGHE
jgi:hypothetical protein